MINKSELIGDGRVTTTTIGRRRLVIVQLAMLISRISRRISNGTVGRPQRCRDFQRQYNLKPARRQRITVSGFTIVNALMVFGANDKAQQRSGDP
jgi:hypothetical protein